MAKYILVHGIRVAKDFTPETFGRLTTIGPKFRISSISYQVCCCECGTIKIIRTTNIGRSAFSCGCIHKKELIARNTKHGHKTTKNVSSEYTSWSGLKRRCTNPKDARYPLYGGRGIRVCDRWQGPDGYLNFLEDMGKKPSPQHSIDRIDVDGDYCPENCRWATQTEQCNNQRRNRILTVLGKSQTLSQWAREVGIHPDTIRNRCNRGWSESEAIYGKTNKK